MSAAPIEHLTKPEPKDPIPDLAEFLITANAISPTYWIQQVFQTFIGTDPIEWVADKWAGDWKAIQQAAFAIDNLSQYNKAYATAVTEALAEVESTWRGNAADGARQYFGQLTTALDAQAAALTEMSNKIEGFAQSSYLQAQALGNALQGLVDTAIILAVEWAAAAALSSTGIGAIPAVGIGALSALQITTLLARWGKVVELTTQTVTLAQGLYGALLGQMASTMSVELPPLPTINYDHPGA
ncbi:hypothetical protein [Nocardia paucivorans]|uniref:hypothetical protein n=1 Tax=Nocardia paucivorans TaxID=114259 RepID=UPI0002E6AE1E|nr:hypothetical protein [Nocardia paucivorans]